MDAAETLPIMTMKGETATITLNRPRHLNRLQPEDIAWLRECFATLAGSRDVRVVILTGMGRVFSAGFDLNELAAGNVGDAQDGPGGFGAMVDALERLPQPTIARLNGGVYGGATDLALACDFRVGIDSMELVMPAAKLGLHYYRSGIVRYASRLGIDTAKKLFLTGEKLAAAELLNIGYLTSMVSVGYLDSAVDELAETLASNAPLAVQGVKLALNEIARGEFDVEIFTQRANRALASADLREGIAAIRARRRAMFTGD